MLSVYVDCNDPVRAKLTQIAPFTYGGFKFTDDPDAADVIWGGLEARNPKFNLIDHKLIEKYESKYVFYGYYDHPNLLYYRYPRAIKLLGQPMFQTREQEKRYRAIPVPMMMGVEKDFIHGTPVIERCRIRTRLHDFAFIGHIGSQPEHRGFLHRAKKTLESAQIQDTAHFYARFYGPGANKRNRENRIHQELLIFLRKTSHGRYGFAPRGAGTSSYRLYQVMMVGSVPIITDTVARPFGDEVDWREFALFAGKGSNWPHRIKDLDWAKMRERAMWFWDNYVYPPKGYPRLIKKIEEIL